MRLVLAAAALVVVSLPWSVASATPSPSPPLETFLVAPASYAFVDDPGAESIPEGTFDAVQYSRGSAQPLAALRADGFVSGYLKSWRDDSTKHRMTCLVVAFAGARGAGQWLSRLEKNEKANQFFVRVIDVGVAGTSFGAHLADTATPLYTDIAYFIRGNDFFLVSASSPKDDLANLVPTQTQRQYDVAPDSTIPPEQWPENAPQSTGSGLGGATGNLILVLFIVVGVLVIGVVAALVVISRRGQKQEAAPLVTTPAASAPPTPQMSADGYYWWDGQAWQDASRKAPPMAQRSADGYYWWDGQKWREVPTSS